MGKLDTSASVRCGPELKKISAFVPVVPPDGTGPALIHFSETPLFRLEESPEKYAHLLKKKDLTNIAPIVKYFMSNSGQVAFLAGDAVANLYLHGRRKKYRRITILAILDGSHIDRYAAVMNNIISSNDGAFSLGFKYRVRKNREDGPFREVAAVRYVIEPRLEALEILRYPFRASGIELELTTPQKFSAVFGVDLR